MSGDKVNRLDKMAETIVSHHYLHTQNMVLVSFRMISVMIDLQGIVQRLGLVEFADFPLEVCFLEEG